MKLEQIEFENMDKFMAALDNVMQGRESFRTIGENKKKIISNNRLYVGNNFSIEIQKADNGKIYLSVNYYSVEDRIAVWKNKQKADEV